MVTIAKFTANTTSNLQGEEKTDQRFCSNQADKYLN